MSPSIAVTVCRGPIGEQPWVKPVATGTGAPNKTPETPPPVEAPEIWPLGVAALVKPPTRKASVVSASAGTSDSTPALRGSAWTMAKGGVCAATQSLIGPKARSASSGVSTEGTRWKSSAGRSSAMIAIAGVSKYSTPVAQIAGATAPVHASMPVRRRRKSTISSTSPANGSVT